MTVKTETKVVRENGSKKMKFYDIAYTVYDMHYSGYDIKYFGYKWLGVSDLYAIRQASQTRVRCIVILSEDDHSV